MSASTLFVTGTDTEVGKTVVAGALLRRARSEGMQACGYKPVASGAWPSGEGLRSDDGLALMLESPTDLDYDAVNPYCFEPAIAPHLAAREAGVAIDRDRLDLGHAALAAEHALVVVEGAGGWQVPLGEDWTFADWVAARQWPVVLVVGLRLGCISHALLSAESIARRTRLAGWIANTLPPAMPRVEDNVRELAARLPAPLLGVIPEGADTAVAAATLDWPALRLPPPR